MGLLPITAVSVARKLPGTPSRRRRVANNAMEARVFERSKTTPRHRWALALALSWVTAATPGAATATCVAPPGDVNGSSATNVSDALCTVLGSLWTLNGKSPGELPPCLGGAEDASDVNCSGSITVSDTLLVIQLALGLPLAIAVDANANSCVDTCDAEIASACCASSVGAGCGFAVCEDCVCEFDPFCCDTQWDTACAELAAFTCESGCACPASSEDCCVVHDGTGCDDPTCEAAVCAADSFCCELGWDQPCALCAALGIGAPGIDCTGVDSACACPTPGACCYNAGCVVALSTACQQLGGAFASGLTCEDTDSDGTPDACPAVDSACPLAGGPCNVANGTPGCEDVACCESVCALDSSCCLQAWDADCAALADVACAPPTACCSPGGCSMRTPAACSALGGASTPNATCADADGALGADICQPAAAVCCTPQNDCSVTTPSTCLGLNGTPYPANSCADHDLSGLADACEPGACCLASGCQSLRKAACTAAGGAWMPGFDCADANTDGVADACVDPGCCSDRSPTPGCAEPPACETCVCAIDSYCCNTAWDAGCASCATGGSCGPGGEPSGCGSACQCALPEPLQGCCTPGGCTLATATACGQAGGVSAQGFGCFDANQNAEADICESFACCRPAGVCTSDSWAECTSSGGLPVFGFTCSDNNTNGVADVCEP